MKTQTATGDHSEEAWVIKRKDGTEVFIDNKGLPFEGKRVRPVHELPIDDKTAKVVYKLPKRPKRRWW